MGIEKTTPSNRTYKRTNPPEHGFHDSTEENIKRKLPMKKYNYQTCLRMSEVLKNSMTEICDTYQINESDFMRRAIAESVQSHIEKTQNTDGKFLFV